jgi:hypothetical protein
VEAYQELEVLHPYFIQIPSISSLIKSERQGILSNFLFLRQYARQPTTTPYNDALDDISMMYVVPAILLLKLAKLHHQMGTFVASNHHSGCCDV